MPSAKPSVELRSAISPRNTALRSKPSTPEKRSTPIMDHLLPLVSRPISQSADCRVVPPQKLCNLSQRIPVSLARVNNRGASRGLGEPCHPP